MATKLIRVSPSILAIDYNNDEVLKKELQEIELAGANMIHIDVMDGKFVKNKTFDHTFVDKIKDMTTLILDVHLMVENPDKVIEDYAKADRITHKKARMSYEPDEAFKAECFEFLKKEENVLKYLPEYKTSAPRIIYKHLRFERIFGGVYMYISDRGELIDITKDFD